MTLYTDIQRCRVLPTLYTNKYGAGFLHQQGGGGGVKYAVTAPGHHNLVGKGCRVTDHRPCHQPPFPFLLDVNGIHCALLTTIKRAVLPSLGVESHTTRKKRTRRMCYDAFAGGGRVSVRLDRSVRLITATYRSYRCSAAQKSILPKFPAPRNGCKMYTVEPIPPSASKQQKY